MEEDDRTTLEKSVKANSRNSKALFVLTCFILAAATPSIVSEWHFAIQDGQLVSADLRSRSFSVGLPERVLIILCVAAAVGVIGQKQLAQLISIFLKSFGSR
jgi:hypothetical protein